MIAQQEAEIYDRPEYADSWVTPDGIERDRERVKKSLRVAARAILCGSPEPRLGE